MHINLLTCVLILSAPPARAADNWPQFRGPNGDGRAAAKSLPLTWSENENIKWKTPIHDRGHSSPVVWDEQVWLTTATQSGREMFAICVDRDTGKILRDIKIFDIEKPESINPLNSYASPTPAVEAGRVYVHFGSYGTTCLDTATGKTIWCRRDLRCNHFRGPGSSVFLFNDLLILTFDGFDVQYLAALDKTTGKTVWKTDRSTDFGTLNGDLRKAYSTPIVVEHGGGLQLVSTGAYATMGYDPRTGEELWKVGYPGGFSNTSRPIAGHGLVFINTGFGTPQLWAVRLDGRGDVTKTHVAWKCSKAMPMKPSPVLVGELIFAVNDGGVASCLEAHTGKIVWQERVGGAFSASALEAAGRIYFFDQDGKTTVIAPDRQYKVLAASNLESGCMATPAVAGKAMFLRSKTHLYRIEE